MTTGSASVVISQSIIPHQNQSVDNCVIQAKNLTRSKSQMVSTRPQAKHKNIGTVLLVAAVLLSSARIATAQANLVPAHPMGHLQNLAESGQFTQLLNHLKSDFTALSRTNAQDLIDDLERFEENKAYRDQKQIDSYNEAVQQIAVDLEGNQLEEALVSAIDAHSLANDPQQLLAHPNTQALVVQAVEAAEHAERNHDWVEALSLYRPLHVLYEDQSTYLEEVKRVSRHVRALQLFAPDHLDQLYRARAQRRGKEAPPAMIKPEPWSIRISGIEESMFREATAKAAKRHVGKGRLKPLLVGAIDGLLILINTQGIEETFQGLKNPVHVRLFRDELKLIKSEFETIQTKLTSRKCWQYLDKILEVNKRTVDFPPQVVIHEMTEGAISTLDEFSAIVWPQEKAQFSRSTQGKFTGVGIQISRRDDRLLVVTPLPGTPALDAGIKAGDIIAQVNGRDTSTWSLDRAVREITGPEGTTVRLGIERASELDLVQIDIPRAEIFIDSIRGWELKKSGGWNYWIDRDRQIGYIRLSQFIPQTADDLDAAIEQMEKECGIYGLILDLRFNPGGLLSSAIQIADRFVSEGLMLSTVDGNGRRDQEWHASPHRRYRPFPVAVLINRTSASASEIVSGVLQDRFKAATIIGTRSFGKGSVQDLFPLAHGKAVLKLTTQYYQLPSKRIIHRKRNDREWGIMPDLVIPMTEESVADAIEFRQELDVLREKKTGDRPVAKQDEILNGAPSPIASVEDPQDPPIPLEAQQILVHGLDPQIEAAYLILKFRQVAQNIVLAQKNNEIMIP